MHPWKIALVRSKDPFTRANPTEADKWGKLDALGRSSTEAASIGHGDLVSLQDGISMSYITVLQRDPEINDDQVELVREELMQRQALELQKKPHFNSIFQIEYRDPSDIRKGFRFKSASGCYIASTFFHNTPPISKTIGNSTALQPQVGRTGAIITAQPGAGNQQFTDPTPLSEPNNQDRIAETLKRTTLIGCTFEPKNEISTFKIVDGKESVLISTKCSEGLGCKIGNWSILL
ncbi:hypothetical protein TWF718_009626 [Orbilia javanica]|uniref:Uncharacterized protein n=1 Tax=Orbilia javanica TaxID=47235 RepID=A0AAN8RLK4_9PEZI